MMAPGWSRHKGRLKLSHLLQPVICLITAYLRSLLRFHVCFPSTESKCSILSLKLHVWAWCRFPAGKYRINKADLKSSIVHLGHSGTKNPPLLCRVYSPIVTKQVDQTQNCQWKHVWAVSSCNTRCWEGLWTNQLSLIYMLTSLISTSGLRVCCWHLIWFWQVHFHWSSGRFSVQFLTAFPSQLFIIKHHTPHWYSTQNPVSVDGIQCLYHTWGSRQHVCSISINLYVLFLYLHSAVIVSLRNVLLMLHISGELPQWMTISYI